MSQINVYKMFIQKTFILLLFLPNAIQSQELIWNPEKSIYTGGHGTNIRPRIIALNESRGIILWGNQNNQSIQYALWEDDQLTDKMDLDINNSRAFVTTWASTELAGRDNYVYIIFKEDPAETGHIYLLRSTDYGKTFTKPIIAVKPEGFFSRFPGIAIDKDHQPIVSYMRFKTDWSEPEYVSIRSADFGESFDRFTEVTDKTKGEACDCCPVTMETDENRIAVFYRNNRNNIRNMTAAISENNGLTYDLTQELDTADWMLLSCPSTGGDGFFNGDELHTSWTSGRTGTSKVYYSRLSLNNKNISSFIQMDHNVGRGFQQIYPRIAGSKDTVGICWNELVNSMDILFSYFVNDQSNELIKNAVRINESINGNQASADIAFVNGMFHLCWQDMNDHSIKYKTGRFKQASNSNSDKIDFKIKYFKSNQLTRISSELSFDYWRLIDMTGKIISFGTGPFEIILKQEPHGAYILHLSKEQQSDNFRFYH